MRPMRFMVNFPPQTKSTLTPIKTMKTEKEIPTHPLKSFNPRPALASGATN